MNYLAKEIVRYLKRLFVKFCFIGSILVILMDLVDFDFELIVSHYSNLVRHLG